jgi:hypothetical protein
MDPALIALIGEGLKLSMTLYYESHKLAGKTEAEIKSSFDKVLADVLAFDPNNIKDV